MKYKEAVQWMLKREGKRQVWVSRRVGMSENYIAQLMRRKGDTMLGGFLKVCDVLGYEVVLRKKNYVKLMDEEKLLESSIQ